jgi:hypothetical protein
VTKKSSHGLANSKSRGLSLADGLPVEYLVVIGVGRLFTSLLGCHRSPRAWSSSCFRVRPQSATHGLLRSPPSTLLRTGGPKGRALSCTKQKFQMRCSAFGYISERRKGRSETDGDRAVAVEGHRAHERKRVVRVLYLLRG